MLVSPFGDVAVHAGNAHLLFMFSICVCPRNLPFAECAGLARIADNSRLWAWWQSACVWQSRLQVAQRRPQATGWIRRILEIAFPPTGCLRTRCRTFPSGFIDNPLCKGAGPNSRLNCLFSLLFKRFGDAVALARLPSPFSFCKRAPHRLMRCVWLGLCLPLFLTVVALPSCSLSSDSSSEVCAINSSITHPACPPLPAQNALTAHFVGALLPKSLLFFCCLSLCIIGGGTALRSSSCGLESCKLACHHRRRCRPPGAHCIAIGS